MDLYPAPTPVDVEQFYRRSGYQVDVSLPALMVRNRDEFGDLPAVLDGEVELTWRDLIDLAARFGGFLQANGVGAGDVVVWQLPNWWESLVVAYGIWAVGAVSSPVVPIYREFELRNVVGAVSPRCVVTAREFRGVDHVDMVAGACADVGCDPATELAQRCDEAGMLPARSWGMTECPGVSGASPRLHSRGVRTGTDGVIAPGCEVRVVDPADPGTDLPRGAVGEMWVRGPQRALGYLDPAHTAEAFDEHGWFRTGDMGFVADDGTVTMTGRLKEIINRGGEKLSSREIEDALTVHQAVREVAVVAAPHPRLGEQPAAFVLAKAGTTAEELTTFLGDAGLAPQKIPRVWRFVDELPRTASGKVRKNELQAQLTDLADTERG